MKKWVASLLVAAVTVVPFLQPSSTAHAAERTMESYLMYDIWGSWAEKELEDLVYADIFKGYVDEDGDSYLAPGDDITRAQYAAIVVRALDLQPTGTGQSFSDVSVSYGLAKEIQIASDHGIILGKDGKFNPNQPITRDQLAVMTVRAFDDTINFQGAPKTFNDISAGYWAEEEINQASSIGIIRGDADNNFRPREKASRAHAGVILHRALQLEASNLPEDALLTDIVIKSEMEGFALMMAADYEGLLAHNEKYYTAFEKAFVDDMAELYAEGEEGLGASESIRFVGEPTAVVEFKTDHFAKVQLTAVMEIKYDDGSTKFETTMDYDPFFLLKKVGDTWKIYNSDFSWDEIEEEIDMQIEQAEE